MPRVLPLTLALAVAASAHALPADRLATLIGDRTAGPATDCIEHREIDKVHFVDRVGIVYETRTRTLYLNRPTSGLAFLRDGVVLSVDAASANLCRGTLIRLINPNSRAPIAALSLGDFVPYVRP